MSFLKSKISLGSDNGLLSVEIEFISDDEFHLHILSVKEKKGLIDFKEIHSGLATKEKTTELLAGKVMVLTITGKGILTKKILPKTEEIHLEDILPNSNKEDFYYQSFPVSNYFFSTVSRKQKVDELFSVFKSINAIVTETYLGYGICSVAYQLLEKEEVLLSSQTIFFRENNLIEIRSSKNEEVKYEVGKKEIASEMIPALCAAIYFITQKPFTNSIESEEVDFFKSEYKQRNYFQKAGALVLISFLLVLFGNYLAYNHYSERYHLLEEEVAYMQSEIDLLNTLKNELSEKQKIIGGTGLSSGYKLSLISDRIGQTVPATVKLTEMNIQPLEKGKLKKNEKANFQMDKVVLKGKIFKSTDINDWIKEIKNDKIVKDVVVTNYSQMLNENFAEFELMIDLN